MSWTFKFDFSTTTPAGTNMPPKEEGSYKVKIISTDERDTQAGNRRALFRLMVLDGKYKGCTLTDGFNFPTAPDDFVMSFWMAFLLSLGVSEKKLAKEFNLKGDALVGKTGHLYYIPAPEGAYPTLKWISAEQHEMYCRIAEEAEEEQGVFVPLKGAVAAIAEAVVVEDNGVEPPPVAAAAKSQDPLEFIEL